MRGIFSTIGIFAVLVLCVVSAAMNYLFLSSLGKTPLEGQVLGAASAAADVLKALLPFFIAWSWQARRPMAAASGSLAFTFFAGFSLLSAIGFAADNRGALVQKRDDLSSAYQRVHDMREYAERQRQVLPAHRAGDIVVQEIERHRQHRRWASTKGCTDATETLSRDFCAEYFMLRAERAAAQEADRLADEINTLDGKIDQLRRDGAGQDSDPQVSLLSRMTGQEKDFVHLTLIITVALLVEIGASLGLFLASGHVRGRKDSPSPQVEMPLGSVEDFALEALVASSGALSAEAVAAAYDAWCLDRGYRPLPPAAFNTAFQDLARQAGIECRNGSFQRIGVAVPAFKQAA
ncbi:conserved membrane protein of unknown function [Candidatus Filomicrobium marinum]|uniref:Uncharacterized protein n=1 Tax=Candidatus Filomicrobium marinum TaxID=1608628 RepID=A0A0D6JFC9_9HYPH|nr:hypothetical protein [Candidatus Filomicrobium marinum]CFX24262.1 conserved membrane protein of unknown function [Candidatus Filomicrobium marinum]CPR19147.1 conserved membrane protein of unknown function [Candidatus Filomicrobium marinum]